RIVISDILVALGWVFFRANSLPDALYVFKNMLNSVSFSGALEQITYLASQNVANATVFYLLFFGLILMGLVICAIFDAKLARRTREGDSDGYNPLYDFGKITKWTLCISLALAVMCFFIISASRGALSASFIYGNF
ncbi:MAG: hypothetical protein RSB03_04595, partial [Oscillospiraceae bacterium]